MANQYVQDFQLTVSKLYNRDTADMSNGDWMCANTSLNKKPFDFTRYPFQKAIADDMHHNLDCMKPSQIGLTEVQIRKSLTILKRNPNTSLIYTMPNERMFKRISKARIKPIIEYDKTFKKEGGGRRTDSMDLINIGSSFLYVTGSSEADATSINADFVMNDEIDLTPQDMLSLFNSRLQGSDHRVNQRFSTPTYEGFGVDKGYARSDQFEYMLKCSRCNHHQIPQFNREFVRVDGMPDDIEHFIDLPYRYIDSGKVKIETATVGCQKCHKPLNLGDYDNREWVAKFPTRTLHRGYRIRNFSTHRLGPIYTFEQMFKYLEKDNPKGFHNTVLGEPYTNADQKFVDSELDLAFRNSGVPEPISGAPYFLGVDIGKTCNIVVALIQDPKKANVVLTMTCSADHLTEVIGRLDSKYRFVSGVLDRYPYTPTVNSIRDASSGRLMPAHYSAAKTVDEVKDELGGIDYVKVNRTTVLDGVFYGIKGGGWTIDGFTTYKEVIKEHLKDMVRDEIEEGQAVWKKLNGNDHFFHALGYCLAAFYYKGVLSNNTEWQNTFADISGLGDTGQFGTTNDSFFETESLIGFGGGGSPQRDTIIRRHK